MKLEIKKAGINGEGIAFYKRKPVFIDGCFPEEVVDVKLYDEGRHYRGELLKIIRRSKYRVSIPCEHQRRCGGCALMPVSYSEQLRIKKQLLEVFKYGAVSKDAVSKSAQSKNAQSKQDSAPSRGAQNDPLDLIREQLRLAGFTDPDRVLNSYPHELSGGMLQRVCIVMALLSKPKLIIADEPTTALDVTVQAQVLAVLKEMAEKTGTAVLLITHNMGIVSQYAHRVAVMYAGRIVEEGPVREVINHPMHPYTQGLLAAIPESHSDLRTLASIPGSVPHPKDFAKGCRFADRCSRCTETCKTETLPPKVAEANHFAYCFNYEK